MTSAKEKARLIAAAPQMFEALVSFERAWRQFVKENPGVCMGAFTQALSDAEIALKKASSGGE